MATRPNTGQIDTPAAAPAGLPGGQTGRTLTLPSGRTAVIRRGKGRDAVKAQMMARSPEEMLAALMSVLVEIDGAGLTLEDALDQDLSDYWELVPFLGMSPGTPQGFSLHSAAPAGGVSTT